MTKPKADELARLRRENRRLRGWLRGLHARCMERAKWSPTDVFPLGLACNIDDALAGKPAPNVKR